MYQFTIQVFFTSKNLFLYNISGYFKLCCRNPLNSVKFSEINFYKCKSTFLFCFIFTSGPYFFITTLGLNYILFFVEFSSRRCILRSVLVLFLVILGEAVPRFDLIMGLIGGCLTGPLMFILPPILYYKLKQQQQLLPPPYLVISSVSKINRSVMKSWFQGPIVTETSNLLRRDAYLHLVEWEYTSRHDDSHALSCRQLMVCAVIIALGITTTILATYFSVQNTILYADLTPSCVMNFTAASHMLHFWKHCQIGKSPVF